GDLDVGVLRSVLPNSSNDVEFFPEMVKKWGLGGLINTREAPTGRSAGSWAWAGLANTYFWIDPTSRVAGLILTQILPFCDRAVGRRRRWVAARGVLDRLGPAPPRRPGRWRID